MADGDGLIIDQDLFDQQADDSLAVGDFQQLCGLVQSLEECAQCFGQAQERHPVGGLIEDRLQFCPHGLLAGAQLRHSAPQFVQGKEFFLIGRDQAFHAFADAREVPFEGFLPPLRRFSCAGCVKTAIEFGTDERGVFDQADHLLPHDLVKQILPDWPAIAHGSAEMAPGIGPQASVVMDFARRTAARGARQRVAAFATGH